MPAGRPYGGGMQMTEARRTGPSTLLVPMRAESPGLIGDGMLEIGPDHPQYAAWAADVDGTEAPAPGPAPRPPSGPASR